MISFNAEMRAYFNKRFEGMTPEHRQKCEDRLAQLSPSAIRTLNSDESTTPRIQANIRNKAPEDFTPEELGEAKWYITETAMHSNCFDEWEEERPEYRGAFTRPLQSELLKFVYVPLPPAFNTKARRMHDGVHQIVLQGWPELSKCQFDLDNTLRRKREFEMQIEIVTFLNAISQHLTGKKRIFMLEEYTSTMEQQMAQLVDLRSRKATLHKVVMQHLIQASLFQRPPHNKGCSCPLCSHMMSCLTTSTGSRKRKANGTSA